MIHIPHVAGGAVRKYLIVLEIVFRRFVERGVGKTQIGADSDLSTHLPSSSSGCSVQPSLWRPRLRTSLWPSLAGCHEQGTQGLTFCPSVFASNPHEGVK